MDKEILSPGMGMRMGAPAAAAAAEHGGRSHKAGIGPAGWSAPALVRERRTRSARLAARGRVWFPAGGAGGPRAGGFARAKGPPGNFRSPTRAAAPAHGHRAGAGQRGAARRPRAEVTWSTPGSVCSSPGGAK